MSDNPFEALRLGPQASEKEVVEQGARLCQRAASESARNAVRQAVQRLTASADERTLHALLTHPRPEYVCAELERLIAAHRRPPVPLGEVVIPEVDREELRDLLLDLLSAEVPVPILPLEFAEEPQSDAEVMRQTAEALWQGLLGDMRA